MRDKNVEQLVKQKKLVVKGFENVKKTQEFRETEYHPQIRISGSPASLTSNNRFWVDLFEYLVGQKTLKGFLSGNFVNATATVAEMVATLIFNDISFEASNYQITEKSELVTQDSGVIVLLQQLTEATLAPNPGIMQQTKILNWKGENVHQAPEYLARESYSTEITLINLMNEQQKVEVVFYYPTGCVPHRLRTVNQPLIKVVALAPQLV